MRIKLFPNEEIYYDTVTLQKICHRKDGCLDCPLWWDFDFKPPTPCNIKAGKIAFKILEDNIKKLISLL